jgi:hypothetical protein
MSETSPIAAPLKPGAHPTLPVRPDGFRFYSSPAGQPPARRATDVLLLVPAAIGLALLIVAYPPSEFEHSLAAFVASFPDWLDPLWGSLYGLLVVWALMLLAVAVVGRRWAVALQAVASVALAASVAILSARLAVGQWPDVTASLAVFLYRLSTFYLPPIWGWFAFRWLRHHTYL